VSFGLAPGAATLPEYVAQKKGFFRENGIKAKLTPVTDISTLPGAVGKQFDFGMSSQPVFLPAVEHGVPIVVTAGGQYEDKGTPNIQLVARPGSHVSKASDLSNKTIGVPTPNSNMAFCLQYWMKTNGVNPKSVKFRSMPFASMEDQLSAHRLDGALPVQPFTSELVKAGNKVVSTPCLSISPTSQGTFVISDKTWAKKHLTVIDEVQKSLGDSIDWIRDNPSMAKNILVEVSGLRKSVVSGVSLPLYNSSYPVSDLGAWAKAMRSIGKLSGPKLNFKQLVISGK
jgi:ABC-type nitrate/sulfonate/bicarbonate transport system substrate-binding protein